MAERRRRHHTVPRFYLRGFANERGQVMRVVLPGNQRNVVSIGDATVENDFYMLDTPDGPSDAFEKALGSLESAAASAFARVLNENVFPIDEESRLAIATWAAVQALRTPATRALHTETLNTLLRLEVDARGKDELRRRMIEEYSEPVTDEDVDVMWADLTRADAVHLHAGSEDLIRQIGITAPKIAGLLLRRGWYLVRFTDHTLATSDHPITLTPDPSFSPHVNVGLGTAPFILLPMDRRTLLIMGGYDSPSALLPPTPDLADASNLFVAQHATRALFHHPDDDPLAGIDLPEPRDRQIDANINTFIHEKGLTALGDLDA